LRPQEKTRDHPSDISSAYREPESREIEKGKRKLGAAGGGKRRINIKGRTFVEIDSLHPEHPGEKRRKLVSPKKAL